MSFRFSTFPSDDFFLCVCLLLFLEILHASHIELCYISCKSHGRLVQWAKESWHHDVLLEYIYVCLFILPVLNLTFIVFVIFFPHVCVFVIFFRYFNLSMRQASRSTLLMAYVILVIFTPIGWWLSDRWALSFPYLALFANLEQKILIYSPVSTFVPSPFS